MNISPALFLQQKNKQASRRSFKHGLVRNYLVYASTSRNNIRENCCRWYVISLSYKFKFTNRSIHDKRPETTLNGNSCKALPLNIFGFPPFWGPLFVKKDKVVQHGKKYLPYVKMMWQALCTMYNPLIVKRVVGDYNFRYTATLRFRFSW